MKTIQANRFGDFGRELEETFERNLLSKFSTYTNADSLSNLTGTADNDTLTGTDLKETIFGKEMTLLLVAVEMMLFLVIRVTTF